ncbi:MAG: lipopolysaccharide biosynthesis protein [Candidatus Rokuibacteriota bacterium]
MTPTAVGRALARNTLWYGAVTVFGIVAGLVMSVLLARGLGPERMGEYSYVAWASRIMQVVTILGLASATARYTGNALGGGDRRLAWGLVRLLLRYQVVTVIVFAAVVLPAIMLFAGDRLRLPLAVAVVGLLANNAEAIFTNALYGAQRYDLTARTSALKMSLQIVATSVALAVGADVLGVVVGMTLATAVSFEAQRRTARRLYPADDPAPPPAEGRPEMQRYLLALAATAVLDAIVWNRSEVFFLGLSVPPAQIAFYTLAYGLATKAMLLPEIVSAPLLPAFSTLHGQRSSAHFREVYRSAIRYVALVGAPIAAIGAALAPAIFVLLYGEPYAAAATLFQLFTAVAVVAAMRKIAWTALFAIGDRRHTLAGTAAGAVLTLGLAALLVPVYGTYGAVAANAVAQITAAVWGFVVIARLEGCGFPLLDVAKAGAAALLALLVSGAVAGDSVALARLVAAGIAGAATFAAGAVVTGVLGSREWALLQTSARRLVAAGRASSA